MNKTYRVVWNAALGIFQVASELAKGRGKTKSRKTINASLVVLGGVIFGSAMAADLPTGGNIVGGAGAISQNGSNMTIDQSTGKMAIDWQGFSVGAGNTVQFNQPGANAIALNRVLGADVSVIQGALQANGQVFLVNPNGVLFTPTARVDVGGLVASTLNISTEDFMAGNYRFKGDSAGAVINQGKITAAEGGTVALVAAQIINDGTITANRGDVLMGAGSAVTLDLGGPVKLEVEEGALHALIKNGGAIRADAGTILLTARAAETLAGTVINSTGVIEAHSLGVGEDGVVTLLGEQGGVQVAGRIDVSSDIAEGGKVVVTGDKVDIAGTARIDATGATGGGEIYVGGGWQGKDPAIKQAISTTIAQGAQLDASATVNGDGGTVVAWSDVKNADSVTRVHGSLKATGGANGGDGGKVETSGSHVSVNQAVDASAKHGKGGLWLLDPADVTVAATGGGIGDDTVSHGAIDAALSGGTDVKIQADNSITWNGDYSPVSISGDRTLTLGAGKYITNDDGDPVYNTGDINLNGSIDARGAGDNGSLGMVFDGNVNLGKDIELYSNGGDILFGAWIDSATGVQADARRLAVDTTASAATLGDGKVTFSDMVGGTNPLDSLYVTTSDDGKTYINGSVVRTWQEQVYNSPVELGTVQFVNPDFEQGTDGWTITDGRFITGKTIVDGWKSPLDDEYPGNNNSNGNNGDDRDSVNGDAYSHSIVNGAEGDGDALKLTLAANCGGSGGGDGYCVVRGPYVVSNSEIALAKGESVQFNWTAQAGPGQDAFDVFGYLLNVETGEAQIILNRTGESDTGGSPWGTATITADKAGTYKFVFVSGSYDFTGGSVLGASLTIDKIATSSGPKSVNGSSITFGSGLNTTDNNLTIKADDINFNGGAGSVIGTGKVSLETGTEGKHIAIGGATGDAAGSLELTGNDMNALGDGFSSINIGGAEMVGDINVIGDTNVKDDLILRTGDGDIHLNAGLTVADVPGGGDDSNPTVIVLDSGNANGDETGGKVDQTADGVIVADGLVLLGEGATHQLDAADNDVDVIASKTGSVSFTDVDDLTVGTITVPDSATDDMPGGQIVVGMKNEDNLSLTADEIDFNDGVSGAGQLVLQQKTADVAIELGESNPTEKEGVLQFSKEDLDKLKDGFNSITIGSVESGDITVVEGGTAEFRDDLNLVAGGKLTLDAALTLVDNDGDADDGSAGPGDGLTLSLDAAGGATQSANGAITADGLALLGGDEPDGRIYDLGSADNLVGDIASNAGKVIFNNAEDLKVGELTITHADGSVDTITGVDNTGDVSIKTTGDLAINEKLTTDANVFLDVAGNASQDAIKGDITAAGLALVGGDFDLRNTGNTVGDIASDAGKVAFANTGKLNVGTLIETDGNGDEVRTITGVDNTGDVSISTDGDLAINEKLTTDGNVFLTVDGTATQDAEGNITADGLALNGGDFELRNAGNKVGDIASEADKVAFVNTGDLKVGTLTETDGNGDLIKATTGVNNTGDVSIKTTGDLAINEKLNTDGNVFLDVAEKTTQDTAKGNITAAGLALVDGDFDLSNSGNTVGDIASNAGKVAFANTGDVRVGTLTETDGNGAVVRTITGVDNTGDVSIKTTGGLAIDEKLKSTGNVILDIAGNTTQDSGKGAITAAGLALIGGNFNLDKAGNLVGDIASRAGQVAFTNTGDLKVGILTQTNGNGEVVDTIVGINNDGKVKIATAAGDINVTQNIATSNAEADAIVLNAGQARSAGDASGGDVRVSPGVAFITGAGGRTLIYTGGLAASTGLTDAVGYGSGNFRYNSDEMASNFTKALGNSGVHAIYRERPTLIVSTNGSTTATKVYDGSANFDGGGIAGYDAEGLLNGDGKWMLGMPWYWTDSSSPGRHLINISGLAELGYFIQSNPANANLTITAAADYDAAKQNIDAITQNAASNPQLHFPDSGLTQFQQDAFAELGVTNGGLLFVDRGDVSATSVAFQKDDGISGGSATNDGDGEDVGGNVCADGGQTEGGACAAYPPQTVFVVRGGVRLPDITKPSL